MIKLSLLFPYKHFFDIAFSIFEEHNKFEKDYGLQNDSDNEYIFEEIIVEDNKVNENQIIGTDVIISRGITSELIKRQVKDIPVVEIPVVGNDLVRSLHEAKKKYGKQKTGVIGSQNMIYGVEGLSEIVGLEINAYIRHNNVDGPELVDKAIEDNCKVIVAGVGTCEYAHQKGFDTVIIKTGKEALWQAITEAKKVAHIHRREQEKSQRFKTILDYAYEGIIALDDEENISVFNSAAKETLSIGNDDVIGKHINQVIKRGPFKDLIHKGDEKLDEIVKYGNINLTVNKVPTKVKDEKVGSVITFQDITGIQKMEGKIREKIYARGHIAKYTFNDIHGNSDKINQTIRTVKRFSQIDSDILIIGESGTGKELFAQSIHNYSNRKKGPFVAVNCAAIPENLLESELFGYVEGAFTGAVKGGKPGFFELAHGGTIFLDEIAEISTKLQCRLLRVLQEREVMRLGDDKIIPVNIRVVTATNKELFDYVKQGIFREDLYYRLDVLSIKLPSLNERVEDIPLIADFFIKKYGLQFGKSNITLTGDAKKLLQKQRWHGNIRQLKNICQRLVVLCNSLEIDVGDIKAVLPSNDGQTETKDFQQRDEKAIQGCSKLQKQYEEEKILEALKKSDFNKSKAAKLLGISRTTLWKKMKDMDNC